MPPTSVMSFGEHLDELRKRLILALAAPLPLAVIFFMFAAPIRNWMCRPLVEALQANRLPVQLQTLNPVETVMLDVKLGIVLALVVSGPWILWQLWCFVAPGLYRHERRFVQFLLPASALLTAIGIALLFAIVLPLMLTMLVGFGVGDDPMALPAPAPAVAGAEGTGGAPPAAPTTPGSAIPEGPTSPPAADPAEPSPTRALHIPALENHPASPVAGDLWIKLPENVLCVAVPRGDAIEIVGTPLGRSTMIVQQYRLSEYIDFVLLMTASVALAFQMPLVILLLGWLDILRLETLRTHRKHALFVCAILAAVLTPSADIVSMTAALIPLYLLYELGLILLHFLPASRIAGDLAARREQGPPEPVRAEGSVARGAERTDE